MKKLSIEEKAKRYDEAKYIMKEYLESGNAGVIAENTIKKAFPELAESENEKIRKSLIILLQHFCKGYRVPGLDFPVSYKDMFAWLEKQGEQKPTEEYNITGIKSRYAQGKLGEMIKRKLEMEKQGEQKYNWSEEDTQYINDTLALLSFGCSIHSVGEVQEWLQSLNNRVQLKQEWNEEDENRINRLIAYFEDKESFTAEDDVVYANWLKSLKDRYTWKPSDAQMASITCAVRKMKESACYDSELVSLYQDLKKL